MLGLTLRELCGGPIAGDVMEFLAHHLLSARYAAARKDFAFEQRLFFVGEATHVHDYSTAHGAYDSGLRAGEEAIAALTSVPGLNATKSGSAVSS
jgi:monoamine oxidase